MPGKFDDLDQASVGRHAAQHESGLLEEITSREDVARPTEAKGENTFDLDALGVDFANGDGFDLKAISRRAAQLAEKRVIERVLQQTRWNRKDAASKLQISYKALLYKMKENGLSQGR